MIAQFAAIQTIVRVKPLKGRVVRHEIVCPEHGRFPGKPAKRAVAEQVAWDHIYGEHHGNGDVKTLRGQR